MKKEENKVIKAYKGFDKDLKCRGFQYEVGKEYEIAGDVKCCENGFHACENPLDVLDHYFIDDRAGICRFCEVEQSGQISKDDNGSKNASSKIKIKAELKFADFIKLGVEWIKEKVTQNGDSQKASGDSSQLAASGDSSQLAASGDFSQLAASGDSSQLAASGYFSKLAASGYSSKLAASGYSSKLAASGDFSQLAASGDFSQLAASGDFSKLAASGDSSNIDSTGKDSVICCAGHGSKVKAKKGSWITLSEWQKDKKKHRCVPKCVKTEFVDGENIKEDTWYTLKDGKFVEVEQ